MRLALVVSVLLLLISILVMLATTVIYRLVRTRTETRSAEQEAKLRRLLVRFLSEDLSLSELQELKRIDSSQFNEISEAMLTKVKGRAKDILVSFLYSRGAIDQAIERTRKFGCLGRCKAAAFLGNVGIPEAREPLESMLRDRRQDVRTLAIRCLGQLGSPESVNALLSAVDDHRRPVPFGAVLVALMRIGARGKGSVKAGLESGGTRRRAVAAELLGIEGSIEDTTVLISLLENDPSMEVKLRSARALGRIGSPKAIHPLGECLESHQPTALRIVTCGALAAIGDRDTVQEIINLLDDEDYQVARAAAKAASQMGPAGIEHLNLVAASNSRGAAFAKEALARLAARAPSASQG